MDGKTKKILNYLKKSGGDMDVLDISFGLNMDEDFVQNALDSLVQENLVTSARNEQGKVLYNLADGGAAPAPEEAPKKAKGKAVAGPEDHFDEFVLENEAVNLVTDTIATHIDDITHAMASAQASAAPAHAAPPPPTPTSTAVFEIDAKPAQPAPPPPNISIDEDDFSPKPKKEKKAAPPPDIGLDDDDFSPKPKKEKKAPPPPDIGIDDDDFSPKPKKEKKAPPLPDIDTDDDDFAPKPKKIKEKKAAVIDDDAPHYDGGAKAKQPSNLLSTIAAAIIAIIVSVILSVAVSGGKTKSAIANVERDVVKTLDFDTYKAETDAQIKSLKSRNHALETKVRNLENRARQDRSAGGAAAPAKKGKKGR